MEDASSECNLSSCSNPKLCYGCKEPIKDEYWLRVSPNLEWHASCLVCNECQLHLNEDCTCFMKEGRPYCKKDYVRVFGVKCFSCHESISDTDYIMRARDKIYHMECFRCSYCKRHLVPGEQFGLINGKLFCKRDVSFLQHDDTDTQIDPLSMDDDDNNNNNNNNNNKPSNKDCSHKGSSASGCRSAKSGKHPRVRTVLSEDQLQTLNKVYAINDRPDAFTKQDLVEITGLNSKVIRVWFQNKRCKEKMKVKKESRHEQKQQIGSSSGSVLSQMLTPNGTSQLFPTHSTPVPAFAYTWATPDYPQAPLPPPTLTKTSCSTIQPIPSTPTHTAVSPIVTYQQNPMWTSPTSSIPHFDPAGLMRGRKQTLYHSAL